MNIPEKRPGKAHIKKTTTGKCVEMFTQVLCALFTSCKLLGPCWYSSSQLILLITSIS